MNMDRIDQVLERASAVMNDTSRRQSINLPALNEVMDHVATTNAKELGYKKHADHTKSSTKGCAMGCLGG